MPKKRKRGRPKKVLREAAPAPAPAARVPAPAGPRKKKQYVRDDWQTDEMFPVLKAAVLTSFDGVYDPLLETRVPRQTIARVQTLWKKAMKDFSLEESHEVTREMIYKPRSATLCTPEDWNFLSEIAVYRDLQNNGMTRVEMITMIRELSQSVDRKTAENHLDYLIRTKKLNGVKRNGRVVTAQKTTSKRSQINIEQQFRWHSTVDSALAEQERLNKPDEEFDKLKEHFFINLDEACLMANDGTVKVLGADAKSKSEKIMDDCRASITALRSGAAGGSTGPWIFLAKGKAIDRKSLRNIACKPGVPPGSSIEMTANAYMTDEVHRNLAPRLAAGIRDVPYICDHPDWWVIASLDGFGSHCNVHEAQQIFYDRKILIIKEEADTSHVNQAYDQSVAKNDKAGMRANLDLICGVVGVRMDQWYLISIAMEALKKVQPQSWIDSFTKVNLHPKKRMSFDKWIKKIDSKLVTGEQFFKKENKGLYDATPACWKRLSVEERHDIVSIIDRAHDTAPTDAPVWTKANVLRLVKYVPLKDVFKLRGCHLAVKRDPSVMIGGSDDVEDDNSLDAASTEATAHCQEKVDSFCSWKPVELIDEYKKDRSNPSVQAKLLTHVTKFVSRQHWQQASTVAPSAYLGIDMSVDQVKLFNPKIKDVIIGHIMYDAKGEGAVRKIAKRRLDMIEGGISGYSRLLNSEERLGKIKEVHQLTASCAEITADMESEKQARKATAAQKQTDKAEKQRATEEAEAAQKVKVLPALKEKMAKFESGDDKLIDGLNAFSASTLKDIIKFYYGEKVKGISTMKKSGLVAEVAKRVVVVTNGDDISDMSTSCAASLPNTNTDPTGLD